VRASVKGKELKDYSTTGAQNDKRNN
jgi:hypothetical protein